MAKAKRNSDERGVALLMAVFALMLLTALGLALLGAADLETNIAANYRDKQNSMYASLSGLQEAADRLIPSRCPLNTPTGTSCSTIDPVAIDVRSLGLGALATPSGCDAWATAISSQATYSYTETGGVPVSSIYLGNYLKNDCPTIVVNGDLSLGPVSGCGVLLVTGNLTLQGNYKWTGPIFEIGSGGSFTGGGGGSGAINGSLFVAQDKNADGSMRSVLGTPTVSFDIKGGGNGIAYDHCLANNMVNKLLLNYKTTPSTKALKVLSVRTVY
jgi:hypothetical protein